MDVIIRHHAIDSIHIQKHLTNLTGDTCHACRLSSYPKRYETLGHQHTLDHNGVPDLANQIDLNHDQIFLFV